MKQIDDAVFVVRVHAAAVVLRRLALAKRSSRCAEPAPRRDVMMLLCGAVACCDGQDACVLLAPDAIEAINSMFTFLHFYISKHANCRELSQASSIRDIIMQ